MICYNQTRTNSRDKSDSPELVVRSDVNLRHCALSDADRIFARNLDRRD